MEPATNKSNNKQQRTPPLPAAAATSQSAVDNRSTAATSRSSPQLSSEERGKRFRRLTLTYGVAIAVLAVISFVIIPSFVASLSALNLILAPLVFLLAALYVGRALSIFGHSLIGNFFVYVVAGLAFLYIFLEGIVAVIGTSLGVLAAEDFANFIPSILVFVSSFLVYGFGNRLVADRTRYAAGLSVRKVSGALVLFSFGLALSAWPPASWLQYTFTYPAVVLLAFSVSPLIAFSKSSSYRNAGMYLLKSSDRWTAIAGLIGFAVSLLSIPKPPSWDYYIFVFVLVMSGLVICYVGFRVYSLGSERIRRVNQEIYSKYQHKLETNFRQDFDFLYSAGENFLIDGEPGRLLVALTLLLSNSGREYDECARLLEPLIRYKAPPVYEYNVFGLRSALEEEADRRLGIFNMVMSDLSRVTTATPAAATLTR